MHAEIADRKEKIVELCRRYRVARLEVFGSAARGTDFDPETSDADFLVKFQPPTVPGLFRRFMGLRRALGEELGRKVDLLAMGSIKNEYLQEAIDRSREVVYDSAA